MLLWEVEEDEEHGIQCLVSTVSLGAALRFPLTLCVPLKAELNRKWTMEHLVEFWKFVLEMESDLYSACMKSKACFRSLFSQDEAVAFQNIITSEATTLPS